jgi:type II secretory pathway pseudopilin PulG
LTTRRALTLIELLLAIGLLLVLGGIVLPSVFTGLRERTFESAAEVIRNQLLLARAHSQATRRPVEVRYDDRPPRSARVGARYFPVQNADALADDQEQPVDLVIVEGWADRGLPDGLRLTDPQDDDSQDDGPQVIRLAVYMPDGSALMARSVWILDDQGRQGRLQVNPWTGLPSFERIFGGDELEQDNEP